MKAEITGAGIKCDNPECDFYSTRTVNYGNRSSFRSPSQSRTAPTTNNLATSNRNSFRNTPAPSRSSFRSSSSSRSSSRHR